MLQLRHQHRLRFWMLKSSFHLFCGISCLPLLLNLNLIRQVHFVVVQNETNNEQSPIIVEYNTPVTPVMMRRKTNKKKIAKVTAFYHVYIPKDDDNKKKKKQRANEIIQEQLQQLVHATNSSSSPLEFSLEYVTIGDEDDGSSSSPFDDFCRKNSIIIPCNHRMHYDTGYEEKTLNELSKHCKAHPDESVVYFHNKGSYNDNIQHDNWRRHMTNAIFDYTTCLQCVTTTIHNKSHNKCDTCGLLYTAFPFPHYAGNFFASSCEYINKLPYPSDFAGGMDALTEDIKQRRTRGELTTKLFFDAPYNFGISRYAMEHWLGSHPQHQPYDISKHQNIEYWQGKDDVETFSKNDTELAVFPRYHFNDIITDNNDDNGPSSSSKISPKDITMRLDWTVREYYFLAGNLLRWNWFYNHTIPNNISWVWEWYPLGNEWHDLVTKFGSAIEAVDIATMPFALQEQQQTECNWSCYIKNYPDLQKAFGYGGGGSSKNKPRKRKLLAITASAKQHYEMHGRKEHRYCGCIPKTKEWTYWNTTTLLQVIERQRC